MSSREVGVRVQVAAQDGQPRFRGIIIPGPFETRIDIGRTLIIESDEAEEFRFREVTAGSWRMLIQDGHGVWNPVVDGLCYRISNEI